ncbi:MAG: hypothetical protein R3336_09865, partial [Phycisphaeraceae bacterium]|nr:hypothetical protein [Phycisphaeraceae bacterium]
MKSDWPGETDAEAARSETLEQLEQLAEDEAFWRRQALRGTAVFASPGWLAVYRLLEEVPEIAVMADSFHVRPLIRAAQDADRFRVVCVSLEDVAVYEGNRHRIEPLDLEGIPTTMHESLPGEPIPEGPESELEATAKDQRKQDWIRRHFRAVADAIHRRFVGEDDLPVILAALPEHQTVFREEADDLDLVDVGIERDPFHDMTDEQLADEAEMALQPIRDARAMGLQERYGNAAAQGHGHDDLDQIAADAVFGKIDTLLINREERVGGSVDEGSGKVTYEPIEDPHTDDLLDDIAEQVLDRG